MERRCLAIAIGIASIVVCSPAQAQTARMSVRGVVFDSVASAPLPGAVVELVSLADRAHNPLHTLSDSLGRFVLADVPRGRYIAGFLHPMLDSLGLSATQRIVEVARDDGEMHVDLAIPPSPRLYAALCNVPPPDGRSRDSTGAVLGYVLSAHSGAPLSDATVIAEWSEFVIGPRGIGRRIMSQVGSSLPGGWFAVCGVPSATDILVRAVSGTDMSSGVVQVSVPKTRIARRNLFVASAALLAAAEHDSAAAHDTTGVAARDTAARTDSAATPRHGGTVLTGWIRTEDGVPIRGAQVRLYSSDVTTTTDADGAFRLVGVPGGTQTLQTRAIGFVPDDRPVDVTDEHLPIIVGLTSIRRFLDTVNVRTERLGLREMVGFEQRRSSMAGHFFSDKDIARLRLRDVTDVFRHTSGVELVQQGTEFGLRIRGDYRVCSPALFVDGKQLVQWRLADLNILIQPSEIAGMEIYTAAQTPAQFRTRGECGTMVVWTQALDRPTRKK